MDSTENRQPIFGQLNRRDLLAAAGAVPALLSGGHALAAPAKVPGFPAAVPASADLDQVADEFFSYLEPLRDAVKELAHTWRPGDPAYRADLFRQIMMNLSFGYFVYFNADADPDNKLLAHFPLQHRLDMEAIRDSVLHVTGQLDSKTGGPSSNITDTNKRRSLYLTVSRTRLDPAMALFDFPDANGSTDERAVTAGPLQGLYWLNSAFVTKQAAVLDERLSKEAKGTNERIERAYKLLYARPPDSAEIKLGIQYITSGGPNAWPKYLQALLGSSEFSSVN